MKSNLARKWIAPTIRCCSFIMLSAFLLLYGKNASGQDNLSLNVQTATSPATFAVAEFQSRTQITLPANEPLSEYYQADISPLNFNDEQEAVGFFNKQNSDYFFSYKVDFGAGKVILHLNLHDDVPTWNVSEWNEHLNKSLNN